MSGCGEMRSPVDEHTKEEKCCMTCVIGLVEPDGTIYFGGDSATVGSYRVTLRKDTKIFLTEKFLIGCCGSARMRQILRYAFVPPDYVPGSDIEKYMATDFVDAVRKSLTEGGFAQKENEQESGGEFLVGFQGRLFRIVDDYRLIESLDGYNVIGSGGEV